MSSPILKLGNYLGGFYGGASFADRYSVLLDGVDEYINIDGIQSSLSASGTGTISLWVKPVDATPAALEIPLGFGDTDANTQFSIHSRTDGKFRVQIQTSGVVQWDLETTSAVFTTSWQHIAVVQDGVSPVIYYNGSAVAQGFNISVDKTVWLDAAGLDNGRIGSLNRNSAGEAFHFNGNVGDVLFSTSALSASTISNIYNSGKPKDESTISGGVSYLTFDHVSDNYNSDVVNEWRFYDSIGANNSDSVNLEEADRELDTP